MGTPVMVQPYLNLSQTPTSSKSSPIIFRYRILLQKTRGLCQWRHVTHTHICSRLLPAADYPVQTQHQQSYVFADSASQEPPEYTTSVSSPVCETEGGWILLSLSVIISINPWLNQMNQILGKWSNRTYQCSSVCKGKYLEPGFDCDCVFDRTGQRSRIRE